MKKIEIFLLLIVLALALILRLYKINRPIADWHSWRQADTAAVARNFIKEGFNPFIPKYDDMSTQASGIENPNRYRFVEFPIFNILIAFVWTITGINTTYARLVTVFITLGSTLLLYLLVKKLSGRLTGFFAAFFFAVIPYNVFYSSTILPAPLMVFGLLALYISFFKLMENEKSFMWIFTCVFFANLAILTWPIALLFMLPLIYLAYDHYGFQIFRKKQLWIILIFSLLPFIAWRIWMSRFPEGIPYLEYILNYQNIRFKGAFFRWILAERIGKLILTVAGFPIFILGLLKSNEKEKLFYFSLLASTLLYFSVFASGNVRHDYYQIAFIPVASIFLAKGLRLLLNLPASFNKWIGQALGFSLVVLMLAFGYYEIQGFYWINKPQIVEAGKIADSLLPKDASVIAPYGGDTAFLYQTNRRGYPKIEKPLKKYIESGTKYIVSVNPKEPEIERLTNNCPSVYKSNDFVIIELTLGCTN